VNLAATAQQQATTNATQLNQLLEGPVQGAQPASGATTNVQLAADMQNQLGTVFGWPSTTSAGAAQAALQQIIGDAKAMGGPAAGPAQTVQSSAVTFLTAVNQVVLGQTPDANALNAAAQDLSTAVTAAVSAAPGADAVAASQQQAEQAGQAQAAALAAQAAQTAQNVAASNTANEQQANAAGQAQAAALAAQASGAAPAPASSTAVSTPAGAASAPASSTAVSTPASTSITNTVNATPASSATKTAGGLTLQQWLGIGSAVAGIGLFAMAAHEKWFQGGKSAGKGGRKKNPLRAGHRRGRRRAK
jgi:hypothetical protein